MSLMLVLAFISLCSYLFWIWLTPEGNRLEREYDKPSKNQQLKSKGSSKSNWEKLPNSPQLNKLRSQWREDKIDLVSFLMEIEELFKLRVEEIADWSKVDPWTDRLEPSGGHKEWKRDQKPSKIDELPKKIFKPQDYNRPIGLPQKTSHGTHAGSNPYREMVVTYCARCGSKFTAPEPLTQCPTCYAIDARAVDPSNLQHVTTSGRLIPMRNIA